MPNSSCDQANWLIVMAVVVSRLPTAIRIPADATTHAPSTAGRRTVRPLPTKQDAAMEPAVQEPEASHPQPAPPPARAAASPPPLNNPPNSEWSLSVPIITTNVIVLASVKLSL